MKVQFTMNYDGFWQIERLKINGQTRETARARGNRGWEGFDPCGDTLVELLGRAPSELEGFAARNGGFDIDPGAVVAHSWEAPHPSWDGLTITRR